MLKIHAHILCMDEADILVYAARHYTSFCESVFVHDMGSKDKTVEVASQFKCKVVQWDTKNKVDDQFNTRIKDNCWKGIDADWVMVLDADEIIYFPSGPKETLEQFDRQNLAVAKPHGFEMLHLTWPTTTGQIYEEAKFGATHIDYCKPVLFAPKRLKSIRFSEGAHHCNEVILANGISIGSPKDFANPAFSLLHYHQVGPIEKIAARYDDKIARMCEANLRNKWGNQEKGIKHAMDKRNLILSRFQQAVP